MSKWLLLDGYNLVFRSYYGVPHLTRADGLPTNAIHGWLRTIWKLEDLEKTNQVAVCFDLGRSVKREALHPEYKANRDETPQGLVQQIPWIKKICKVMGYPILEEQGLEADDIIASAVDYLKGSNQDALIVSADKDLAQLIQSGVRQLLPPPTANPKLGWRYLDLAGVEEKFSVRPGQIIDYLALMGDSSDNINGIAGVGPKTAVKWLKAYGNIEGILNNSGSIKPTRFQAILKESHKLLKRNIELVKLDRSFVVDDLTRLPVNRKRLVDLLNELEMNSTVREVQKRYPAAAQQMLF